MNKWLWFLDGLRRCFVNLFLHNPKDRYWVVTEDRLNQLQQKEKSFNMLQAECELWHKLAELNKLKLQDAVWYIQELEQKAHEK